MTMTFEAQYTVPKDQSLAGNPLIEALPDLKDRTAWLKVLMHRPDYEENYRLHSEEERMNHLQSVVRFHQPDRNEIDIAFKIDKCIRWSYVGRNPLLAEYAHHYSAIRNGTKKYNIVPYEHKTYGFSIIGISGIGKSTSVEIILNEYPQVLTHHAYHGKCFIATQIPWLKIDMPVDGSVKGFCMAFFRALDILLGTDEAGRMTRQRITLDNMMTLMQKAVITYHVGIIIVDELQNLVGAGKRQADIILNFLVSLVNMLGIPVITIGTPKALELYQSELQQAKRGSGQGSVIWNRMQDQGDWERFMKAMWTYQYTRVSVPLDRHFIQAFYEEAQGIPFIAVHLYKLIQERAILNKTETFTACEVHSVASTEMKLTEPMRKALRNGSEVDLQRYLDIRPMTEKYCSIYHEYDIANEQIKPASPSSKESIIEKAISLVCMLSVEVGMAKKAVIQEFAACNSQIEAPELAKRALLRIMCKNRVGLESNEPTQTMHLETMNSYEQLKAAGMIV